MKLFETNFLNIVSACIDSGDILNANRTVEEMPYGEAKHHARELIIGACVKSGLFLGIVYRTAKFLRRRISQSELESFLQNCLQKGEFGDACKAARALGRDLGPQEIHIAFDAHLERNEFDEALKALEHFPIELASLALEAVLAKCAKYGDLGQSLKVVKTLGRKLTVDELETIRGACVRYGAVEDFLKVAKLMALKPTDLELETITNARMDKCRYRMFGSPLKAAMLIKDDEICRRVVERMIGVFIAVNDKANALKVIQFLDREFTPEEIGKLVGK